MINGADDEASDMRSGGSLVAHDDHVGVEVGNIAADQAEGDVSKWPV